MPPAHGFKEIGPIFRGLNNQSSYEIIRVDFDTALNKINGYFNLQSNEKTKTIIIDLLIV